MGRHRAKNSRINEKRPFSNKNVPIFVSLRGRSAAVAILKFEVWHPVAKHGSTKQKGSPITKNMDSLLRFASSFFISWLCFVPRNHSSFRDDKSFRLRLPRRGTRPPRNDKSDRFCGEMNRFSERKVSNFSGATPRKKRALLAMTKNR